MAAGVLMDKLLTTEEAADLLSVKPQTLRKWRMDGQGPEYYKLTNRLVVYERKALNKFLKGKKT